MKKTVTLFALHSLTNRNINENFYDDVLEQKNYYSLNAEKFFAESEKPSKVDRATGQIDMPLIAKGVALAKNLADQIVDKKYNIEKIYCANQSRCLQTAVVVAEQMFEKTGKKCQIIVDDAGRLDARGYGEISAQNKVVDELEHFWKYKFNPKNIVLGLTFLIFPKLIGAEKKSDFRERVYNFFNEINAGKKMKSVHYELDSNKIFNTKRGINSKENLQEKSYNFDNALIIGGSDIWKILKNNSQVKVEYNDREKCDLRRGQIAEIELPKELKLEDITKKKSITKKQEGMSL